MASLLYSPSGLVHVVIRGKTTRCGKRINEETWTAIRSGYGLQISTLIKGIELPLCDRCVGK